MNKLTSEQIEVAVNWWADRVCQPEFHAQSQGEHDETVAMAEVMAYMLTKPVEGENRDKFVWELRKRLSSVEYNPYWGLHVDYGPDHILAESAKEAKVGVNNFPWKTGMCFGEDGSVKAKVGYGAELETLLEGEL